MVWYFYSILTSFSLVGLVLCIKWLTNLGYSPKQILLFMVGIALIGFLGMAGPGLVKVFHSDHFFSFLFFTTFAGGCAAVGHWADFEAIKKAPNPGYATAIRNCSILPVIILSVFIFDSPLTTYKLVGAVIILAGILALVVDTGYKSKENIKDKQGNKTWAVLSLTALACYSLMVFGIKKATMLGFAPPEICAGIYTVNLVFFAALNRKEMRGYFTNISELKRFIPPVIIAALFAVAVNLFNVKGLETAPTPGYHEAIRSTNILLVTLLAVPLFSTSFDKIKAAGVLVVLSGIVVLVVP